jgi:hypothetical protein
MMNRTPGFTAEASLPRKGDPSTYRNIPRDFDHRSRIVPSRGFIGDMICRGAIRACFDDVPGACRFVGTFCLL